MHAYVPTKLLDDTESRRQAEASSLAWRLGRKEGFEQAMNLNEGNGADEKRNSRVAIVDKQGQVLADSENRELEDVIDFADRARLFAGKKGSVITTMDGQEYFVGHAASTGYETYATGWHAVCIQACEPSKNATDEETPNVRRRVRRTKDGRPIRRRRKLSET